MTETDEKPEEKKPVKQGLHGWKAALAMFGCGSLAAFAVFGVLSLLVTSIFDFTSSGVQGGEEPQGIAPDEIGEPQASIDPGDLDLCSRNLESSGSLNLIRVDSGGNFEDPGYGETRVVRDQCEWELTPDVNAASMWDFEYKYKAFISDSEASRGSVASQEFDAKSERLSNDFNNVSSQGEESLADQSHYVYGEISPGVAGYYLVAQTRSAVYEIKLTADGGVEGEEAVPVQSMRHEAKKIVDVSDVEFGIWIPK
ncbi:hypothetical protein GCM10007147_42990 [Nocardiopsis kunsanensis]|uniref:Uncharacterized protein n=1 Tax=Nocardiopsis kunsanensis TaxID=141693 RepID=A0A918XLN3_9ACTN|nr:hypothetical protein [Nocardiopsis kunsanensis]GHD36033.1 hypothetical protein GCM10007147_42990 [Nocardiopsis kunsanensis]